MASHTQVNDWSEVNEDFKGEMKRDVNRKIRICVFPISTELTFLNCLVNRFEEVIIMTMKFDEKTGISLVVSLQ